MSQEHVDLVRQGHDAFNRRDLSEYLALQHPDVEFLPYEVSVQGGDPYRGHEGVRRWWNETLEVLPDIRSEIYETRDFGERIFVRGRLSGHGAGSGASFERTLWQALELRDRKIVWWRAFVSEEEAVAAARSQE